MAEIDASEVLRGGLLQGVPIALAHVASAGTAVAATAGAGGTPAAAGAETGPVAAAVRAVCAGLGAAVHELPLTCSGQPEDDDAAVEEALAAMPDGGRSIRMLVVDAGGPFASARGQADSAGEAGGGAQAETRGGPQAEARGGAQADALISALEASWRVTRAVANAAFIAGGGGGRIAYLAPPSGSRADGEHADAARAGLENLARTLSIEWARYGITPVTIAPGRRTTPRELAGVVAYLASPAGSYFSGCLLDLTGPG